ncbi:hypothetical protein, partial [Staphylococcus aureus]|uniref:hypothetical protein n=1 Tax=Staphylococcus aureus TaxID=1280 RepID=UPI0039BE811B
NLILPRHTPLYSLHYLGEFELGFIVLFGEVKVVLVGFLDRFRRPLGRNVLLECFSGDELTHGFSCGRTNKRFLAASFSNFLKSNGASLPES